MDYMRISGTKPSSVIVSQTNVVLKVSKQAKAKRGGVIISQNYNFNHFNTDNFDSLKTLRIKPKSIVEYGYVCPRGLPGPPAVTLTK